MSAPLGAKHSHKNDGEGLRCPVCHSVRLKVTESRSHLGFMRRTRKCLSCDYRFYTTEMWSTAHCEPIGGEREAVAEGFVP